MKRTAQANHKIANDSIMLQNEIAQGIALIEQVHTLPLNIKPVPAKTGKGRKSWGTYWRNNDNTPRCITVSKIAGNHIETFLHEVGHYLDNQLFGSLVSAVHGSSKTENTTLDLWWEAITDSQHYKNLKSYNVPYSQKHAKYLTDSTELFACSYMQYIATKTGNTDIIPQDFTQWSTLDFIDISAAFDLIFESLELTI